MSRFPDGQEWCPGSSTPLWLKPSEVGRDGLRAPVELRSRALGFFFISYAASTVMGIITSPDTSVNPGKVFTKAEVSPLIRGFSSYFVWALTDNKTLSFNVLFKKTLFKCYMYFL